jgi:DnaJ-class molecular chaperone
MEIELQKLKVVEVEVIAQVKCSQCDGSGIIQHPAWARYWRQYGKEGNMLPDSEYWLWWSSEGYKSPPPEEVECPICGGKGTKQVHILLSKED